jgi:hypothetical protein
MSLADAVTIVIAVIEVVTIVVVGICGIVCFVYVIAKKIEEKL